MSVLAAKAVTFGEALDPSFAIYNDQILANARALAQNLIEADFDVVTNGTDTPFVILDMKRAKLAAKDFVLFLDSVGIAANVVPLAGDKGGFDGASGIRLGVSAVTSRGFAEDECQQISEIVREAVTVFRNGASPRESALIRASVSELCDRFPLPRLDQLRLRTSAL
jgi:glycine hydroxymethyltransferase